MPTYESVYTGTTKNPLIDSLDVPAYKLIDDNNSFVLEVGMIIKFTGVGWATAVRDKTYLVTANNPETQLELYKDENGIKVYGDKVKHTSKNFGTWDKSEIFQVAPHLNSSYWANSNKSPQDLIDSYNADANRLPVFDGFRFDSEDNLWTSCGKAVVCYNNKGEQIDIIEMPERVSNVEFGGVDGKTLFITASTSVYMTDMKIKGAKFV